MTILAYVGIYFLFLGVMWLIAWGGNHKPRPTVHVRGPLLDLRTIRRHRTTLKSNGARIDRKR